jgi:hypothetical protein
MEQEEPEDEYDDDKYDENGNEEMRIRPTDVDDQVIDDINIKCCAGRIRCGR